MDFTTYLFWGGLVLSLSAGMLLAVSSLIGKLQALFRSAHLRKNLSIGASMLAGVIILSAGLVAATPFLPYAPPPQKELDQVQPDRASGEGTPPFGRWDEESIPPGQTMASHPAENRQTRTQTGPLGIHQGSSPTTPHLTLSHTGGMRHRVQV